MKYFLIIAITLCSTITTYSQTTVEGTILDAETSQPIPYVNIGIPILMKGTVSDSNGKFTLGYNSKSDSVTISAIGYFTKKMTVENIFKNREVYLAPKVYQVEDIVVYAKDLGNEKILGNKIKKKEQSISFGNANLGTEIGVKVEAKRKIRIESAHFIINFVGAEDLLYRVNIYKMDGDKVGENLLPENVIIQGKQLKGTLSVDLSKYEMVIEGEVLLSLEYIEGSLDSNTGIAFRAKKGARRKADTFMKYTSLSEYRKVEFVNYQLGFYLVGREVVE
tara:strand:- start:800 stop:1633 length:834 start_codon:yes stop_codon:yes gene_type:complete